jgi:CheY-like chemotaxis protein
MLEPLRTLIVEDQAADATVIVRELKRAGFDPKWKRVETEEDYLSQLAAAPDVILADSGNPDLKEGLSAIFKTGN